MVTRRILSSLTTAAICLSMVQPAFAAASSDDILAQLKSFDPNTICEGRTGRNLGKCIGDVVKRLAMMRDDFNQALRLERDQWYKDHGVLGVSAEYRAALDAYLTVVSGKRDTFTGLQRDLEKVFYTVRKEVLDSSSSDTGTAPSTPVSLPVTPADVDAMVSTCAKQANTRSLRVCMRVQLRLKNMPTPLNVSGSGARTLR